ncbi:MAG TPA: bifunctional DNA-binding transcriptional regulator/O6-methylguanine-DNA methyltransferase Ada [Gemmatimonadaceae bacterium]|nr:bifunctional DNA-binding transcriptional regulator/O6-methylguanine-DNA methyltransferase Ada [Gemmatimonadaceae bacterium]
MAMIATDEDRAWESVLARDAAADGSFIFAVSTTGVYCRPSCPSRRPNRENVSYFPSPKEAAQAGFRACLRCRPNGEFSTASEQQVQAARKFIDDELAGFSEARLTLDRVAREVGAGAHHLQRRFKQLFGLTPAEYVRARRSEKFKAELRAGETVSRATFGAGYGSSSRLYENATRQLGMSPATYRRGGEGATIRYGEFRTPLGIALVAATAHGVCSVTLGDNTRALVAALEEEYPRATIAAASHSDEQLRKWGAEIAAAVAAGSGAADVPLDVEGTDFQRKVWTALRGIASGDTRSYSELAEEIDSPGATRAVASACARNRLAVIIPCHRVVRETGELGGYRWGVDRKRLLLERERSARERGTS